MPLLPDRFHALLGTCSDMLLEDGIWVRRHLVYDSLADPHVRVHDVIVPIRIYEFSQLVMLLPWTTRSSWALGRCVHVCESIWWFFDFCHLLVFCQMVILRGKCIIVLIFQPDKGAKVFGWLLSSRILFSFPPFEVWPFCSISLFKDESNNHNLSRCGNS